MSPHTKVDVLLIKSISKSAKIIVSTAYYDTTSSVRRNLPRGVGHFAENAEICQGDLKISAYDSISYLRFSLASKTKCLH